MPLHRQLAQIAAVNIDEVKVGKRRPRQKKSIYYEDPTRSITSKQTIMICSDTTETKYILDSCAVKSMLEIQKSKRTHCLGSFT